jgi:hypothetical protein
MNIPPPDMGDVAGGGAPQPRPPQRFAKAVVIVVAAFLGLGLLGNAVKDHLAPAASSSSPPSPAVSAHDASDPSLESLCHLPAGASSKFTEQRRERQDLAGVPRLSVWGTVPHGLSQEELLANVCLATATAYTGSATKLGAVTVFAYRDSITTGSYTAARGVFAPGGQWERADPKEPLANWKLVGDVASGYFDTPVPLAKGTVVTLADKDDKTVLISSAAERWGDAEHVADVPNGTKARVLSHREFPRGDGTLVRYEVETTSGRKRHGWVHDYAVHASATSK